MKDFSCFRAAPDGEELIYVNVCPAVPPVVCHWQYNLLSFGDSCQIVVMALTPFYMIAMSHCHRLHQIKIVLHAPTCMCVIMEVLRSKSCYHPPDGPHLLFHDHATTRSGREVEIRLIRLDWNFPPIDGAVLCESEGGLV